MDQLTNGQLEWSKLEPEYDVVTIGYGKDKRQYPIVENADAWKALLKKQFPNEHTAIDEYYKLMEGCYNFDKVNGALKLIPLWLAWFVVKTGILNLVTQIWTGKYRNSIQELVKDLTTNKDLQTVFCYCWGDYGTPPDRAHFLLQVPFLCFYNNILIMLNIFDNSLC